MLMAPGRCSASYTLGGSTSTSCAPPAMSLRTSSRSIVVGIAPCLLPPRAPPSLIPSASLSRPHSGCRSGTNHCPAAAQMPACGWVKASLTRQQARERVLQALREGRRQGPRAGLPYDVQRPTLIEHSVTARTARLTIKADGGDGVADMQVAERDLRQPLRQVRVDEQHVQRGI